MIVSLDIALLCFLPLPLVTLRPTLNNSFSLLALIPSLCISEKEGVTHAEITHEQVFSLACRITCSSDPGTTLQLGERGEREGAFAAPLAVPNPAPCLLKFMGLRDLGSFTRSEQSSPLDSWTLQRGAAPFHLSEGAAAQSSWLLLWAWEGSQQRGCRGSTQPALEVRGLSSCKRQVTTLSIILWIKNEHRGVKWHQGPP